MTRRATGLACAALLVALAACATERATREDCELVLGRIVEIELAERGYRDPLLLRVKRDSLRTRLAAELDACVGRALPPGAMQCVRDASNVERLTHDCLARH